MFYSTCDVFMLVKWNVTEHISIMYICIVTMLALACVKSWQYKENITITLDQMETFKGSIKSESISFFLFIEALTWIMWILKYNDQGTRVSRKNVYLSRMKSEIKIQSSTCTLFSDWQKVRFPLGPTILLIILKFFS